MTAAILAIDPGPRESAWVWYDDEGVVSSCLVANDECRDFIREDERVGLDDLVIEDVTAYGMPVGRDVFETCVWIGRFIEAWGDDDTVTRITRPTIKTHLCGTPTAKDANVRQALIDRFPATGGGKTPAIGTKSQPGPLHGMKSHLWSALAVAVVYAEQRKLQEQAV